MAGIALNKSSLKRERDRLAMYGRFLPSLDLKRRQLMAERAKARDALARTRERIAAALANTDAWVAPLGFPGLDLSGLVRATEVSIVEENVVGTRLPKLTGARFEVAEYSMLTPAHWVDDLTDALRAAVELRLLEKVEVERVRRLEDAVRKITQRVNLFEKVLMPQAKANIKAIEIHLSDAERSAVCRSKLAKKKRAESSARNPASGPGGA